MLRLGLLERLLYELLELRLGLLYELLELRLLYELLELRLELLIELWPDEERLLLIELLCPPPLRLPPLR